MPPIDTSALASIFAWVWSQYGKQITDKTLKGAWERLRWEDRALAYGQKVQRLYGTMQILGQAKPVPLEGLFTAVSLLDKPTAWRRYTVAEMEAEFAERRQRYFYGGKEGNRRDGLAMVRGGKNLFILGKPGAGKTTFLKYLALKGVSGELERVPIFIGLKQLADSDLSVFDFVVREFDVCDFPDAAAYLDRLLKSGKAVLLFDGLDEVNVADDERAQLIADVENFTRKYVDCQGLITCRLAANDYTFQNYLYVEMADFNEGQIRGFVSKWFSDDEMRLELFLSELQKSESEGLRELARVPLLLALLCLGFEETLKLSSRRVELYEEALDALLKKWDSSRKIRRDETYRELSLKRKEQMLAQVAAKTFDQGEYFIPRKTLVRSFEEFLARVPNAPESIDGDVVLQAIVAQHGLFLERARDIYSFAHLTFHEYFAAHYVVENEARGTLHRLIAQYSDPRYREIILLTVAQLPDATHFFDLFLNLLGDDISKHENAVILLSNAANQAEKASDLGIEPFPIRVVFLYLALIHGRMVADASDIKTRIGVDIEHDRRLVQDLARIQALNLERPLTFVEGLKAGQDLALSRMHSRYYDLVLAYAHGERELRRYGENIWPHLKDARTLVLASQPDLEIAIEADLVSQLAYDFQIGTLSDKALSCIPTEFSSTSAAKSDIGNARFLASRLLAYHKRNIILICSKLCLDAVEGAPSQVAQIEWAYAASEYFNLAARIWETSGEAHIQATLRELATCLRIFTADTSRHNLVRLKEAGSKVLESAFLLTPTLRESDGTAIARYLKGTLLLLECLSQAAVDDREAIKERLLLLPSARLATAKNV